MRHPGGKHIQATSYNLVRTDQMFRRAFKHDSWAKDGFRCAYCREKVTMDRVTADHLLARSKGGQTERKNIKAACPRCNNAKGSLTEGAFKDILHSQRVPRDLRHLNAWVACRLEKRLTQSLRRLRKYAGLPQEAS